jgi:hypothetical protein
MLVIMLMSSAGCIGLVPAREFVEEMMDEPSKESLVEKIALSHNFVTPWDGLVEYSVSQQFEVDQHVSRIGAYLSASIPLGDNIPLPDGVRYVEASLVSADGEIVWSERLTDSDSTLENDLFPPLAEGTWTLTVEARGYGVEGQMEDSFHVLITIERDCIIYPSNLDECIME